jgi:hypothetical protein
VKNILFDFESLGKTDGKVEKTIRMYFKRAGLSIATVDVSKVAKRSLGYTYREVVVTFSDSQSVTLRVKQSGDIFQTLMNGKLFPIKNQDDHQAAIKEMAAYIDRNRTAFQKLLSKVKAPLPASIKTAAPKMLERINMQIAEADEAIATADMRIAELEAAI